MPHALEAGTIRIIRPDGSIAGTGFLVSRQLAVTCAHVVRSAGGKRGGKVSFEFHLNNVDAREATVLENGWSEDHDVATLEFAGGLPENAYPLKLRSSRGMESRAFLGLGYPESGPANARSIQGSIGVKVKVDGYASRMFQIQGSEVDLGHSGSALVDTDGKLFGMLTGYIDVGRPTSAPAVRLAYAIPIETIWEVYPSIKDELPVYQPRSYLVEGIHRLPYDYATRIQNFLTNYLGTETQPVPFGGRDADLARLTSWLDKDTSPYLLLAAPAGRGKSSLLVRWLESLKSRGNLALAFVPVSVRFRTNLASAFYPSLAARLAFLHREPVPESPETRMDVYRGLVSRYLGQPLPDGRTLLVVLDGVDEAGDWQVGADFLPAELPDGVRVVVSARYLAGDEEDERAWLRRLGWERRGMAASLLLGLLTRSGVGQVVRNMGFPMEELGRRADIVAELYRLSAGDPLLVKLYVADLWSRGEGAARLEPGDLVRLNPGYDGYFSRWWEDQIQLWGQDASQKIRDLQRILALLSCALGPLTRDDILALEPELGSFDIESNLISIRRFILGEGDRLGYSFHHPKLGQYFWERLGKREQNALEARFVHWGDETVRQMVLGNIIPAEAPEYVVRYFGAHLDRSDAPLAYYRLFIEEPYWHKAWFAREGAYGGYLRDLQRVWEKFRAQDLRSVQKGEKASCLGGQIRCGLIEASLHSLAENIPPKLISALLRARIWTLAQTWVFIHQISDEDQRAETIIVLLDQLSDEQLPDALDAALGIANERVRSKFLCTLAERLPKGELGGVLDAARKIENKGARARVLTALAEHLPEAGREALDAARRIEDEWERIEVLIALAGCLPEAIIWALETARTPENDWERARVLSALAERLPVWGLDGVVEAALIIEGELGRSTVLSTLAERLPEDELGRVLDVARTVDSEYARAGILGALAVRQPDTSREALDSAQKIENEEVRAKVLITFAEHLQESELVGVLEAALTIEDDGLRAQVLSSSAERLPVDELGKVLDVVRAIENEEARARVLGALAKRLPVEELGGVLDAVRAIGSEYERARVLTALAERLPEAGREALDTARNISDDSERAKVLTALALRVPEAGREALDAARIIEDEGDRAVALIALAWILQEDELGGVVDAARAIRSEYDRAIVLSVLGERLPEAGREALETTQIIEGEVGRSMILVPLAEYLPKGELGGVLDAARTIWDQEARTRVLNALAERLPDGELGGALDAAQIIRDDLPRAFVLTVLAMILPEAVREALDAARTSDDDWDLAEVLSSLALDLPEYELSAMLEVARTCKEKGSSALLLSALAWRVPEAGREALDAARKISDDRERAHVLSALAERMPDGELGGVLDAALTIEHEEKRDLISSERARVLSALAERMPEGELGGVLDAAPTIEHEETRARVLGALVKRLPVEELGRVLDAARRIVYEGNRASVLIALAERLPEGELSGVLDAARKIENEGARARVLTALAEHLPEVGREALDAARKISDDRERAHVLSALAERFPEVGREALDTARNISDDRERAKVLTALAGFLPEASREALDAARNISDDRERAEVLTALAGILPEAGREALDAARKISDDRQCAEVLIALAERLPEKWLGGVLDVARTIGDDRERVAVFYALAGRPIPWENDDVSCFLEFFFSLLALRKRSDLLYDITALFPVLLSIGDENLAREILKAVQDVTNWWR